MTSLPALPSVGTRASALLEEHAWPALHGEFLSPEVEKVDRGSDSHQSPHRTRASRVDIAEAKPSEAVPAYLLKPRIPSQLCCWANGCFPLPPVIPLQLPSHPQSGCGAVARLAIQLLESAQQRLQAVAGAESACTRLRIIAVQKEAVVLDEESALPPSGKALWISMPMARLCMGVVYLFVLSKINLETATNHPEAAQQLSMFASLPILVLPTAAGSEMEDLFGAMIEEMSSREVGRGDSPSSDGGRSGSGGSDGEGGSGEEQGQHGSLAEQDVTGGLQRRNSAPVVSIQRSERVPSEASRQGWKDQMRGSSKKSEKVENTKDSHISMLPWRFGTRSGAYSELWLSCASASVAASRSGTPITPASSFSAIPPSLACPSPPASNLSPPLGPQRRVCLMADELAAPAGPHDQPDEPDHLHPSTLIQEQQQQQQPVQAGPQLPVPALASRLPSPALPVAAPQQHLGLTGLPIMLTSDAAEAVAVQLAEAMPLTDPQSSAACPCVTIATAGSVFGGQTTHTVFRSAASACNLALSLLSSRSPSVRSMAKSVQDGYSTHAGLVAASKRMQIYASSADLVGATYATHFGPLCADLGFVLETSDRCASATLDAARAGTPAPGVAVILESLKVPGPLLIGILEDVDDLFDAQGMVLCTSIVQKAVSKLCGGSGSGSQ